MKISLTPLADVEYNLQPPYQTGVDIAGLPVKFAVDASAFYVAAVFENVTINGSPLVAYFDPPVADVDKIDAPSLLLFLLGQLSNGAIIGS